MMMRMLKEGGIETLTDDIREADEDNLRGYYEFEKVKQLHKDASWIKESEGKAVKVVSSLLKNLPPEHEYRVIFMERNIDEVLASQRKMMERRGEQDDDVPDELMSRLFEQHLQEVRNWLDSQPNLDTLYVSYNETLKTPQPTVDAVNSFLGGGLDTDGMTRVVDPDLYRQRSEPT